MVRKKQTLDEAITLLKNKIAENKLNLSELSANISADEELIAILLDENNGITKTLSNLFQFAKIKLATRELTFNPYKITQFSTTAKISRAIHPRCTLYFDKPTQKFYNFRMRYKKEKITNSYKQLIINEMSAFYKKSTESSV